MVKVKICGITNLEDALTAIEYGADALGFMFYRQSPRSITPDKAAKIIKELPPFVTTVGVFVNEERDVIETILQQASIDIAQLHGNETPDACIMDSQVIKAIRVKDLNDLSPLRNYRVSAFLLDTYAPESFGGTGQIFNWDIALEAKQFGKIILAGGLNPDNVGKAVKRVRPYGVDVSSGIEAEKGRKDRQKMKLFIERAKAC